VGGDLDGGGIYGLGYGLGLSRFGLDGFIWKIKMLVN
jgi:hypothetical protein